MGKKETANFLRNKKAELTSKQLITIIILIISFSIIIIFFFSLNLKSIIDTESCRNSVMMKGVPGLGLVSSVKCKTIDVCLSMGDECDVVSDNLKKIEVENKGELLKEMSNLIAECWWMMGEGEVEYSSDGCAICHKVYFDKKIQKEYSSGLEYTLLYEYMANKMPGKDINYLFYLYKYSSVDSVASKLREDFDLDISSDIINVKNENIIITSVKDPLIGDIKFYAPIFMEFSGDNLRNDFDGKFNCKEYVTEA